MDSLMLGKFTPKVFFHNVAVFKDSLPIYINPYIAKFGDRGFVVFKVARIFWDIIAPVPVPAAAVHLTYLTGSNIKNSIAPLYPAYLTFSHTNIITQRII
jgi:hypothetical protein